jgi:hypothetical protein
MAIRKPLPPEPTDDEDRGSLDTELFDEEDEPSSAPKQQPLTVKALLESGIVGLWKDRTDIGDTLEYVQRMKDERRERRQERLRKHVEDMPSAPSR